MDPEDKTSTEPAAQPDQDSGMVEVHDASIEDLDSAIANAQAEEANADPAPEVVTDDSSTPNSELPDGEVDPAAGQPADQSTIATQGADPSKPQPTAEELQAAQAENARLKNERDQKELFIQHRGNELGKLKSDYAATKRQLADARAQLANGIQDRWQENPAQANIDQKRIDEIDNQLEAVENQEGKAERIVEAQTFFLRNVDTNKVTLDDMSKMLADDGVPEQYISQFKANPWEFTTPEALVQMGKRALERKDLVQADSDRRTLAKHVLYLNNQIAQLKQRPGQVMKQVQKSLNAGPSVTAQSTVSPKAARDLDPTRMSVKELDAALAQATRH